MPSVWDDPVIVQDLYHTILDLANLPDPSDGRSIFNSPKPQPFYWRTPKNLTLLYGDWKLVLHNASPFEPDLKMELYHLANDVSERFDCVKTHPEEVGKLLAMLQSEFRKDAEPHINPELLLREGK